MLHLGRVALEAQKPRESRGTWAAGVVFLEQGLEQRLQLKSKRSVSEPVRAPPLAVSKSRQYKAPLTQQGSSSEVACCSAWATKVASTSSTKAASLWENAANSAATASLAAEPWQPGQYGCRET